MKYRSIRKSLPAKMINAGGKVVVVAEKSITEKIKPTALYPEGVREVAAASQADLKYGYEVLGLVNLIEQVDDTTLAADLSKNDKK